MTFGPIGGSAIHAASRHCTLEPCSTGRAKQRMPNLLLIGPTNNGKSDDHREILARASCGGRGCRPGIVPVVAVQMPSDPRSRSMPCYSPPGGAASSRMRPKSSSTRRSPCYGLWEPAVNHRQLHNILAGPMRLQLEFLNLIRFLGNETEIPIIGVGRRRLPGHPLGQSA